MTKQNDSIPLMFWQQENGQVYIETEIHGDRETVAIISFRNEQPEIKLIAPLGPNAESELLQRWQDQESRVER